MGAKKKDASAAVTNKDRVERAQIYRGGESAPTLYVNSIRLTGTTWDLRMRCCLVESADDEKVINNVVANIFMTPQHAKELRDLLADCVDRWIATGMWDIGR